MENTARPLTLGHLFKNKISRPINTRKNKLKGLKLWGSTSFILISFIFFFVPFLPFFFLYFLFLPFIILFLQVPGIQLVETSRRAKNFSAPKKIECVKMACKRALSFYCCIPNNHGYPQPTCTKLLANF